MSVMTRKGGWRRERVARDRRYQRRSWGTKKVAGAGAINALARLGFIVRGIIYIVVGAIAVMMAFGTAQHTPDRAGAVEAVASKPFGYLLLWILTIGFAGLALWQLVLAVVARLDETGGRRLKALGSAIGYAVAFVSTWMFVRHGRVPGSSDTATRDVTAMVLSHDGGQFIVAIAGLVVVACGIYLVLRAVRLDFTGNLRTGWMSRRTRNTVIKLGRAGFAARGVIVFLIGVAVIDAAVTYNAAKAEGVDGALRTVATQPFGPVLLILVALGLIAFGLLSFFEAKWRRTYGGVPV